MSDANRATPPGWPRGVPPAGSPGWEEAAVSWLLDQCPADFRGYAAWRRHPIALAWVATWHVDAQLAAMREAYRRIRVEVADDLPLEALAPVMEELSLEGLRMRANARAVRLVHDALRGYEFVPRL